MNTSVVEAPVPPLARSARCDQCGAQAFVVTTMPSGFELLWCGHHFAGHEAELAARGATVTADERHTLNPGPQLPRQD